MYPVLTFGSYQLSTFSALLTVGFISVLIVAGVQARRYTYSFSQLQTVTLFAIGGGALGARFFHMLFAGEALTPAVFLDVARGTFFFGFLLGLALGLLLYYFLFPKSSFWMSLDILVPAWLSMQFFGRLGCFCEGCCYGSPSELPWSVTFTSAFSQAPLGIALHPTQLYEAAIIFILIFISFRKQTNRWQHGTMFFLVLIVYSFARFFLEFLRADPRGMFLEGPLSTTQGLIAITLPAIMFGYVFRNRTKASDPPIGQSLV